MNRCKINYPLIFNLYNGEIQVNTQVAIVFYIPELCFGRYVDFPYF